MGTSESTKIFWEFSFDLRPTSWEVRVLISVRAIRDMVRLADVSRSGIRLAVGGVITQWFHFTFAAFVHHNRVVVPTHALDADSLEFVHTCIGAIFSLQLALEGIIWLVWRRCHAHDVSDTVCLGVRCENCRLCTTFDAARRGDQ